MPVELIDSIFCVSHQNKPIVENTAGNLLTYANGMLNTKNLNKGFHSLKIECDIITENNQIIGYNIITQ